MIKTLTPSSILSLILLKVARRNHKSPRPNSRALFTLQPAGTPWANLLREGDLSEEMKGEGGWGIGASVPRSLVCVHLPCALAEADAHGLTYSPIAVPPRMYLTLTPPISIPTGALAVLKLLEDAAHDISLEEPWSEQYTELDSITVQDWLAENAPDPTGGSSLIR